MILITREDFYKNTENIKFKNIVDFNNKFKNIIIDNLKMLERGFQYYFKTSKGNYISYCYNDSPEIGILSIPKDLDDYSEDVYEDIEQGDWKLEKISDTYDKKDFILNKIYKFPSVEFNGSDEARNELYKDATWRITGYGINKEFITVVCKNDWSSRIKLIPKNESPNSLKVEREIKFYNILLNGFK